MGQIRKVQPVKFIVGILAIGEDVLADGREVISRQLGSIDSLSEVWPFTSTSYYAKEMSDNLLRQFVSLAELGDPADITESKLACNCAELADAEGRGRGQRRAINLDPGYISPAKLVLASTKDYSHRIYLSRGIYAETTLQYESGSWRSFPWSFPDYAEPRYHQFFSDVRNHLLEALHRREKNQ